MAQKRNIKRAILSHSSPKKPDKYEYGDLDLRRKAQICSGKASDYAGHLVQVHNPDFDMDKTIFANLTGLPRIITKLKLSVIPHYNDKFVEDIEAGMDKIPKVMPPDLSILEFMKEKCDFSCEHADGSFWDHLRFCYDYSAIHFKAQSPRVLLLHSILGVGTNLFPCAKELMPELASLLDPTEMKHIEAFPSVLRLILNHSLLDALNAEKRPADTLDRLTLHRLIDNETISLSKEDIWVQMNYQLIHQLDFLPAIDWEQNIDDPQFQVFIHLFEYLKKHDKLWANVDMDVVDKVYGLFDLRPIKIGVKKMFMISAVKGYSDAVHHDLGFELAYAHQGGQASL